MSGREVPVWTNRSRRNMRRPRVGFGRGMVRLGAAVVVLAAVGCGGDDEREAADRAREKSAYEMEKKHEKTVLSETVLDSLRAMKVRFSITRDEYRDDKGGVLANEYLEVWYPVGGATVTHGMHAFGLIVSARDAVQNAFGAVPGERLTVRCAQTMADYTKDTGKEWWRYGRIRGDEIEFQPVPTLYQRGLDRIAVPREYYLWALGKLSAGRLPEWWLEGYASLLSGEGPVLRSQMGEFPDQKLKLDLKAIESALRKENDRMAYRIAAFNAFSMIERLLGQYGPEPLSSAVKMMKEGKGVEDAIEASYGKPYRDVVEDAMAFEIKL